MSNSTVDNIQMVDVVGQYQHIKQEVDEAVLNVISTAKFINGPAVKKFEHHLAEYLGVQYVIGCANGTDALQIALMACDLKPGDEVIVPSFTYVATAEVIALLRLKPVMIDVDSNTFNTTVEFIQSHITPKTKAIVPVHLYGQSCDMESIMDLAKKHNLFVIEDNAQAIGADYTFSDGRIQKTGTIGHIGCTSFYPSKNLGCYGDGGAIFTNDEDLANKIRMIANHGQSKRYYHSLIGVNSRLDSIQAAVLDIKLKHLDQYAMARQQVAAAYDKAFTTIDALQIPTRSTFSTHVFHQYTLRVKNRKRNELKDYLAEKGIPSMIYYPVPLYEQEAFKPFYKGEKLSNTEQLSQEVISLPIHTEMEDEILKYIIKCVCLFFEG